MAHPDPMIRRIITTAALSLGLLASALHAADQPAPFRAEILPGWRLPSGDHISALRIVLDPGWKTYWRAPGDAGIPPVFDWHKSQGVSGVQVIWPVPHVFDQQGLQSIGYANEVVLPLRIDAESENITLNGRVMLGICKDICIPEELHISATLPSNVTRPDARITAALANVPLSASEAGVGRVTCLLEPSSDGVFITAKVTVPSTGRSEIAVIETGNPYLWVAQPKTERHSGALTAHTEVMHVDAKAFAVQRNEIRITVLGSNRAVDILGCPAP
jgi:DsbC/DsbD-like thiol-disulfide interchange protein